MRPNITESEIDRALGLPCVVSSPKGDELVDPRWCEEPTRCLSADESRSLVNEAFARTRGDLHSRPTVPSMRACYPVPQSSRRPDPKKLVTLARVRLRRTGGG